jgi:uncharacterized membrane protein YgaE (UPF0421/DUF939 family)
MPRWRPALQAGVAAGLSWWIAETALGHPSPLSAPVVATIAIGAATTQRLRRTVEVMLGVSLGIGLATLLVAGLGRGPLQLALVVTLGMVVASALRGGELLTLQAGLTAVLVFASAGASAEAAASRLSDALVGGGCALAVSVLLLPPDPARLLGARVHVLLAELRAVLTDVAVALRARDSELSEAALDRARATDRLVAGLSDARPVALEIARFVPAGRRRRHEVAAAAAAVPHLDHIARNVRVIARAVLALTLDERLDPSDGARVADELAEAIGRFQGGSRDGGAAQLAALAADQAAELHERTGSTPIGAVATAIRGIAEDLALAAEAAN